MDSESTRDNDSQRDAEHRQGPVELGDRGDAPADERPRRHGLWWSLFAVAAGGSIFFFSRPGFEASPPSIPVAVHEGDGRSENVTLDDAVRIAREGLVRMDNELIDYVGRMTKRERIDGTLGEPVEMEFKIRTRRAPMPAGEGLPDLPPTAMAVYLRFLNPASTSGREVIWVEDKNDGNLIAHEGGFANLLRVSLDPKGFIAMRGNLHPLTEIGFQNLVRQLLERSELVRQSGGAEVTFVEDYLVGDRSCLLIQVRPKATALATKESNPETPDVEAPDAETPNAEKPAVDFWLAEIAIDRDRGVPLRYAAYAPPEAEGEQPPLIEEYVYYDVRLNVGLTDADFDPDNPEYSFP